MRNFPALFLAVSLFLGSAFSLEAQVFRALTPLLVISTGHFDIIYPEESAATARSLAGFADEAYERVSGIYGITIPGRIPVTISPHTDRMNGYQNPLPYTHIVLYAAPADINQFTTFDNALYGLFIHELNHVISRAARDPLAQTLFSIFGSWASPALIAAPRFMTEGSSILVESLDGAGRGNDPLYRQKLIQAFYEGAFLDQYQIVGYYDLPPAGSAPYDYGGPFNSYLLETFGMEKYVELWQALGSVSLSGVYGAVEQVYGRPFVALWDAFKASFFIGGIEENPEDPVYEGAGLSRGTIIGGLTAGGGRVFALDQLTARIVSLDTRSGRLEELFPVAVNGYHLAASSDGSRLLVSAFRTSGDQAQAIVTEYDTLARRSTGRSWEGLFYGTYFRDGVLGGSSEGQLSHLVYRGADGREELLLRGANELSYTSPVALDDTWIAFIAAFRGKRTLCLYNYETREVYSLRGGEGETGADPWEYIRGLSVSGDKILFAYNDDERLYKLGMIDWAQHSVSVVFSDRDFSGGVFVPVLSGDQVYYRGAFATWDALLRFPEPADSLSGRRAVLSLEPWSAGERALAALDPASPPLESTVPFESRPYNFLSYLNPFQSWLPLPLIRTDAGSGWLFSVDGFELYTWMEDPTDTNQILLYAGMDIRHLMGVFNLNWTSKSLGFPLILSFSDDIDKDTYTDGYIRSTKLSLSGSYSIQLGDRLWFSSSAATGLGLYAPMLRSEAPDLSSAYTWPYEKPVFSFALGLGLSTLRRQSWELFGNGLSFTAYASYAFQGDSFPEMPRFEGIFRAAFESGILGSMQTAFFGAWDKAGMKINGVSSRNGSPYFEAFASREYQEYTASGLQWLAGNETKLQLFSLEVQDSFIGIYVNRIFGTMAWRGTLYDDRGTAGAPGNLLWGNIRLAHALVFDGGISLFGNVLTLDIWGALKLSNLADNDPDNDFAWGLGFNSSVL
ncbi:MAG: hypothetical protein LBT11_01035 [Treponema sp.]|nr:hypothetical protein [Treponema sp.]